MASWHPKEFFFVVFRERGTHKLSTGSFGINASTKLKFGHTVIKSAGPVYYPPSFFANVTRPLDSEWKWSVESDGKKKPVSLCIVSYNEPFCSADDPKAIQSYIFTSLLKNVSKATFHHVRMIGFFFGYSLGNCIGNRLNVREDNIK